MHMISYEFQERRESMSKFLGILATIGIFSAFILFNSNHTLSMELALGSFFIWFGWTAWSEEVSNEREN